MDHKGQSAAATAAAPKPETKAPEKAMAAGASATAAAPPPVTRCYPTLGYE